MAAQVLARLAQVFSISGRAAAGDETLRPRVRECRDYLERHRDRIVGKQELMDALWGDRVVTEQSLFQCIAELRAACGRQSVRTYPGRGYQWRPGRPPVRRWLHVAVLLAPALVVTAALFAGASDGPRRAAPAMTVALLPVAGDTTGFERALVSWLSEHVPAVLVTGPSAVGMSRAGTADIAVDVTVYAADDAESPQVAYRLTTPETSVDGELSGASVAAAAAELGSILRDGLVRGSRGSVNPDAQRDAAYRDALSLFMAGETPAATAHARRLLREYPDFLPAHSLLTAIDLGAGRRDAADRRIEQMLAVGEHRDSAAWTVAGLLARADALLAGDAIEPAGRSARAALELAVEASLHRQAGKAAEQLAAIGIARQHEDEAMQWLVDAYGHYDAGRCTVGTARVERQVRTLIDTRRQSPARPAPGTSGIRAPGAGAVGGTAAGAFARIPAQ